MRLERAEYMVATVFILQSCQSNVPNPNITWEVANQYNAGFESQLFQNSVIIQCRFLLSKT